MNVKTNSKYVKKNDVFVCIHDELEDRHRYIKDIKRASAIVIDKDIKRKTNIPLIKVNNTNDALFEIYDNYYQKPLENLNIIGITGTDGKTTTAMIIKKLLSNYEDTAYLGTNGFIYKNKCIKTRNTTPAIDIILKYANVLRNESINNLVMEASSEGLLHNRCKNLSLKRVIITNITGDHLNIHKSFDNYLNSKLKIFSNLRKDGIAIVNIDDSSYKEIRNMDKDIITYGKSKKADYQIMDIKLFSDKTLFSLKYKNSVYNIESPLLGEFNVYNLTSAVVCLCSLDYDIYELIELIKDIKPISGRINVFKTLNGSSVILDYAHTKRATFEILKFANSIKTNRIITVLGSAGGRETEKRKDIGKLACDLSDKVIFTMDDPRNEKVKDIIKDLTCEVVSNNYISVINRKKAIRRAIEMSMDGDIVLILGKGMDSYMAVKNKYKKYNDFNVIKKYLVKDVI